jgi:transcriptional antiterminator NusG
MIINDESWYLVRNTRGVTGFVGPSSKPIPLTDEEVKALGVAKKARVLESDYKVGETVKITSGPFENFVGKIESINLEKEKVKVFVSMFGRETLVELELNQIDKM